MYVKFSTSFKVDDNTGNTTTFSSVDVYINNLNEQDLEPLKDGITEGVYTSIPPELLDCTANIINNFSDGIYNKALEEGSLIEPNGRNGKMHLN